MRLDPCWDYKLEPDDKGWGEIWERAMDVPAKRLITELELVGIDYENLTEREAREALAICWAEGVGR